MTDAIRERHVEEPKGYCKVCIVLVTPGLRFAPVSWPCDAAIATARADKAEAELAAMKRQYGIKAKAMLAAEADAERLAEALRYVIECWQPDTRLPKHQFVLDALEAHIAARDDKEKP